MNKKTKIILIVVLLLGLGGAMLFEQYQMEHATYRVLGNNSLGSVEKIIYGNESVNNSIALITGIHPREKLSIDPEIKAAKAIVIIAGIFNPNAIGKVAAKAIPNIIAAVLISFLIL